MYFLGYAFLGGATSVELTPTNIGTLDVVEFSNAKYDDTYITNNPTISHDDLPDGWDSDTELYGKYDTTIHAGNIEFTTDTIDTILIKRRKKGSFKWTTILVKTADSWDDLRYITGYDYTAAAKTTYEYAVVPTYQYTENVYYINEVYSDFDGLYIAEKGIIYGTPVGASCDITRNTPSSVAELLNNKYPKFMSNSALNYDSGQASGQFIEMDCLNGCATEYISTWENRDTVLAFLTNRKPKILKYETGASWLISVTGSPTDSGIEAGIPDMRSITFDWTETGDKEDEASLYYAGIYDVPSTWWNG